MPIPTKAVVISNCQAQPLSAWLTLFSANTVFEVFSIHLLKPQSRESEIAKFVDRAKLEYQLILTVNLSSEFGALETGKIAQTFYGLPVIRISNIYFSGLHPDLMYIGGLGKRVTGPLIDYHSKIAVHGYLRDLSIEKTTTLYTETTYCELRFYEEMSLSLETLKTRDSQVDIPISNLLPDYLQRALCFFSVNHPTSALLAPYCHHIIRSLAAQGLGSPSGVPLDSGLCADTLANNVIFPIYPEIAARHGIPWLGSYVFRLPNARSNPVDLAHIIAAEFECFNTIGREVLMQSAQVKAVVRMFEGF
jgi:hypothetical protein